MKNEHAKALGKIVTVKKSIASRENGKKGGRPVVWDRRPMKGMKNPKDALFRYTLVRVEDGYERFVDRLPRESDEYLVWDNRRNCQVEYKETKKNKNNYRH